MHTKVNMKNMGLSLSLLIFVFAGCGKGEKQAKPVMPQKPVAAPPPEAAPAELEEEKPVYVYSGDRFKDPFLEVGQASAYSPEAVFNPDQAKLRGVIYSPKLRSAVIQVAGSGSYFIRENRIIDVMGKVLTGYKAKIFPEKVVLSGEEDDVFELKIRESDDDEEKL